MSGFSGQIATSGNDAGEEGGDNTTSGAVTLGGNNYRIKGTGNDLRYVALRFTSVTIAQGSTISAATVSPWIGTADTVSGLGVFCEAADNSAALSSSSTNISSRTESTHSATWTATLTASAFNASPSIVNPVNDVISRPGFASGNALTVILDDGTGQNSNCAVEGYAGSSSEAAELSITYTTGGSTPSAPTGLTLSLNSDGTLAASWTNPSGTLTGVAVNVATNSAFTTGLSSFNLSGSAVTSCVIEANSDPIGRDTTIYVEVAATNSAGTGTYCTYQSITTGPAAPTSLAVTNAPSPVATWINPTPGGSATLTNNIIEYSLDMLMWTAVNIGSVVTSHTFTGLTANKPYYFRVSAVDSNGQGYYSGNWLPIYASPSIFGQQYYTLAVTAYVAQVIITLSPVAPDLINTGWTITGGTVAATVLSDGSDSTYVKPPANQTQPLVMPLENCPSNILAVVSATMNARNKYTGSTFDGVNVWMESASYYIANGINKNTSGTGVGGYTPPTTVPSGSLTTSFANYSQAASQLYGTQGNADWTGAYICMIWNDSTGNYEDAEVSITIVALVPLYGGAAAICAGLL
jgi:fibronectin type III domain protein